MWNLSIATLVIIELLLTDDTGGLKKKANN